MPLSFISGIATYSLTDIADGTTAISAKTAWNLRRKISGLSATDGQITASFLGGNVLLGGDLATAGYPGGDNAINALDYSALRGAWGASAVGDINGDGNTDNTDYLMMKANWYKTGNAQ